MRQGGARAKRAKIFVVRVLIFPQIVTKAMNTNKNDKAEVLAGTIYNYMYRAMYLDCLPT